MRKLLLACVVLFGSVGLASAQTAPKKTLTLTKTTVAQTSRANLTQEQRLKLKLQARNQKSQKVSPNAQSDAPASIILSKKSAPVKQNK
ncbi:MAG: hypothetical protein ABIP30_16835 [Ferruginibacter sp.]